MEKANLINKIVNASGNVAKSFLGLSNYSSHSVSSGSYREDTPFSNSGWLFDSGSGMERHFTFSGLSDVVKSYEQCPPVYSIINKQAYAFINGKTFITDADGKEVKTDYANKVRALLHKPNALQNGKQFEAQAAIYLRLFGYCVILPIKPVGFKNEEATALWIIPPYMCRLEFAKQTFFNLKKGFIQKIVVKYGNEETTLLPDDVIILRDITPGFSTLFLPESPIKPLQQNISNLIGLYNSKGMLINYRGALGILSPELDPEGAIAQTPEEKEEIQNGLMRYGLKNNQWKFIVASSAMKWQQMGVPYRDLMLTEWAEDDTMVICDGFNYPFRLLASTKSSSMNGTEVESFKKILYQDFVIPFAEMIYEQLSEAFGAPENNCKIEKDYSHVPALQEDDVKKATARLMLNNALKVEYEAGLLTLNQWLEKLGEDNIGELGNVRSTDVKNTSVPLATIIGVGGVQSLVGVLSAANISEEARSATIQILFGISPENAALMTAGNTQTGSTTQTEAA